MKRAGHPRTMVVIPRPSLVGLPLSPAALRHRVSTPVDGALAAQCAR
jgi:hypothetical protein